MPEKESEVAALHIGGTAYTGWQSVDITTSISQGGGVFNLTLANREPGGYGRVNIANGAPCTVSLAGQTVITGRVLKIRDSHGRQRAGLTVNGLDNTCRLAKSPHIGKQTQWLKQDLLQIAKEVLEPFDIPVRVEAGVDVGEPFADERYRQGQPVLDFLRGLAFKRDVLLLSYGDGGLVITTAQAAAQGGAISQPGNVLRGDKVSDDSDRYSLYVYRGQSLGGDPAGGLKGLLGELEGALDEHQASYIAPEGRADDSAVAYYRPKVVNVSQEVNADDLAVMAQQDARISAGRSRKAIFTVPRWRHSGGRLWRINTLCSIQHQRFGLRATWLLESVRFHVSKRRGPISVLQLVHPDAYLPMGSPEKITGAHDGYEALF